MAEAAKLNEDLGAKIIDINFGCPVKKVVNGYAGSALMKDECKARQILEAVVNAVKIPVTVKMRMGWNTENLVCSVGTGKARAWVALLIRVYHTQLDAAGIVG